MNKIFASLADGQVARLYHPGQFIYLQGADPNCFFYLLEGIVRSFITSLEGAERVLALHHAGDLMGEASFFDGSPRVSSAVAVTDCKVISVNGSQLERIFQVHPELAFPMLRYLSRTVRLLSGHVDTISFQRADRRLASTLLQYMNAEHRLKMTQEELGAIIGARRVTVSRGLSRFARLGWIQTGYRTVCILNQDALAQFAGENG